MRIRKKLVFLHTCFSLGLAAILVISLKPAISRVVEQGELSAARLVLDRYALHGNAVGTRSGSSEDLGLGSRAVEAATGSPGVSVAVKDSRGRSQAVLYLDDTFHTATVRLPEARAAVAWVYVLMVVALLAVYALVAGALELFVLPQHVYGPIRRMLHADKAVQEGRRDHELIAENTIPADELGEIMRSRNESILALRRNQAELADALQRLEQVATDLKRKNHLLESARRNLMDADRLANLGMMSAGIAHELNTPLAVLKGLVEELNQNPGERVDAEQAALMLRVVERLERLGDGLLDFARVRAPKTAPVAVGGLVEEAMTLVRLDRETRHVEFVNKVPDGLVADCDGDRMVQVLVNLLRNGADAIEESHEQRGQVTVGAERVSRDEEGEWVSVTVADTGPGIDPELLSTIFDPFVSTRLDARGTGLGLAVAEGIVKEHGGVLLARNRASRHGAVFEIMLPGAPPGYPARASSMTGHSHE